MHLLKSCIGICQGLAVLSFAACSESAVHISITTEVPADATSMTILSRFERQDGRPLPIETDMRIFSVHPPPAQPGTLTVTARPRDAGNCRYGSGSLQRTFTGVNAEEFEAPLLITRYPSPLCNCTGDWCRVPEFPDGALLLGIAGTDRTDVLAVGDQGTAFHFDGAAWTPVPTEPELVLTDVWAGGPKDLWAVFTTKINNVNNGGVIHFNGTAWEKKQLTGDPLFGIWGSAADDAWAVGNNGAIWRFDGTSWRHETWKTDASLRGVHGTARDDVWLVGSGGNIDMRGHIIHWNGSSFLESAQDNTRYFNKIWAYSRTSAYVAGIDRALFKWDGTTWMPMTPPDTQPGDIDFYALWGSDPDSLWLAAPSRIYYWDGRTWAQQLNKTGELTWHSLWGINRHEVWAVGSAWQGFAGAYVYLPR